MKSNLSYTAFANSPHPSLKNTTYFEVYDTLFAKYVGQPITFVEIGIFNGGSLFMWRSFFGPQARIIGIDLNPNAKVWEKDGFEIFIGDQADPDFWADFNAKVGPVDIMLDDGGHTYTQQIVTTECVLDTIKDGGMLVVEDVHTSYMTGFGEQKFSFVNYVSVWINKINSRFGKFPKYQNDRRVWSVEVFDSIVAFKINRQASGLASKNIWNKKPVDPAKDFRHLGNADANHKQRLTELIKRAFSLYCD